MSNIPSGYQQVMPYLIINNASAFMNYMKNVFGAEEKMKVMRDESTIMHAEIKIGDSVIMFADATPQYEPRTTGLFIYVNNADETYRKAMKEGSVSLTEPADQSYGRSCGVVDPFGNTLWITSVK